MRYESRNKYSKESQAFDKKKVLPSLENSRRRKACHEDSWERPEGGGGNTLRNF
jgi:hypothetical protein